MTHSTISLRGVAVNNLREVDLDLPHRRLIAFCGVSGSGKTSLALDTLYAEGQRRYIESFSTYTRQFLEQLDKPAAESIEGIPPSIAVTRKNVSRSSRATVGSATQVNEHLQLLILADWRGVCHGCGQRVSQDSADSAAERVEPAAGTADGRLSVAAGRGRPVEVWLADLIALGYRRVKLGRRDRLSSAPRRPAALAEAEIEVVLDRLVSSDEATTRLRDSLEAAQEAGRGSALVWIDPEGIGTQSQLKGDQVEIDGQTWFRCRFSQFFRCEACNVDYPALEPQLLNYNNPLGACPTCEGFGNVIDIDMDRVVPDSGKSLREGAIAPWNTPAYSHELQELLALASIISCRSTSPSGTLPPNIWRSSKVCRNATSVDSTVSSMARTTQVQNAPASLL